MLLLGEHLKEEGYSISIPLLRGHGTRPSDLKDCTWYDWFEDAKQALFELRKNCDQIYVCGLSTGGSLALHLAAHYQVEGVAALSPAIFLKNKMSSFVPYIPPVIRYRHKKNGPDISDKEVREAAVSYDKSPLKAIKEVLKLYAHIEKDLPDIYTPTLIIQSTQDHVVDFKSAEWIYDNISSATKQFLKLQKSFHVITRDIEKEIVFREISQFISRRAKNSV